MTLAGHLLHCAIGAALLAQTATAVPGQEIALETQLSAHAHTIRIAVGDLAGPGGDLLKAAMGNVQFVALGEEHNTRAIPAFTTALFEGLHKRHGFHYLALEEGPYVGQLLSRFARTRGREAALALGLRHPNAFHMYTVEELRMIGDIGRVSTAQGDALWGLNQEFGASHVYLRLTEIAPNDAAKLVAGELLNQALAYEAERFQKNTHYLAQVARPGDFERLRGAFAPEPGSEADRLIAQTALSHRIYAPYAANPPPASEVFHASGLERETNMKHLFAEQYRAATAKGDSLPKVVVKSGALHLYRGLSERTELYTLGNFLSELAIFNGKESFHLWVTVVRVDVREGFLAPFAAAARPSENTLFDLRPLQPGAARNTLPNLDPQLRRLIMGYDALVLLRDGEPGSIEPLRTPNFRWYPEEK